MDYFDPETNEHYIPYVVEPSLGADRVALAFLCDAYDEEVVDAQKNDTRVVLRLHPALAPYKACVLPLSKKLNDKARRGLRRRCTSILWWITTTPAPSASGTAARMRSARRSASPTTLTRETDGCVTVRDRDTMQQERIKIEELVSYIEGKIAY